MALFSDAKTWKNRYNEVSKSIFFLNVNFEAFFLDFSDFGSILGGSGLPKIAKNRTNSRSGRVWKASGISERLWDRFRSDFTKFGMDFQTIFEEILKLFRRIAQNCLRTKLSASFEKPSF